jgi:hypothetical protein
MFLTHRQCVPDTVAAKIAIASDGEPHASTFQLYACRGYLGQSAEWDRTEHGEASERGYAFGMSLRDAEERADALRDELTDLAQRMMRAV